MSIHTQYENVGPGFGGWGGGFGGFGGFGGAGLVEGLLFASLLGNRRGGLFGGDGGSPDLDASGIAAKVVELQNSANIRKEVSDLGNEVQNAFSIQNLANLAQFNQTNDNISKAAAAAALAGKEAELQALITANRLQTNIETLSTKTDAQFTATLTAIKDQGCETRELIMQQKIDSLQERLERERDHRRATENELTIVNTNTNINQQFQAQAQLQTQRDFDHQRRFDAIFDQVAKQNQGIINLGTMVGNSQAASNTNVKG